MRDITSRLTSILQGKDDIRGWLGAFQPTLEEIERALADLLQNRWIDTAAGKQLDGCGSIVLEPRIGRYDEEYRAAIRYRIFVITSQGTPSDINQAVRILTQGPYDQHYWESYPAAYVIHSGGPIVPTGIGLALKDVSPAGIGESAITSSFGQDSFFLSGVSVGLLFKVNGKKLSLSGHRHLNINSVISVGTGSTLGGIILPTLTVNGKRLKVGGKRLRIAHYENQLNLYGGEILAGAFSI